MHSIKHEKRKLNTYVYPYCTRILRVSVTETAYTYASYNIRPRNSLDRVCSNKNQNSSLKPYKLEQILFVHDNQGW